MTLIGVGGRAAGCALLGGMIHASELASSIEHALPMQLDQRQMKTGFVPPAVAEDSGNSYSGTIPMGSRFALPSILTLPATLTVEGRALAKAYQKYGGYIIDSAGGTISFGFAADDVSDPQVVNMETDCEWIRDNLVRVLPR